MANQQNGFYYQYTDGLITIPYNNIALTAGKYYTLDLTDQMMAGNNMDCQSIYIDARKTIRGILLENQTTGQIIYVPPGFMGWRVFPCKAPINIRILCVVNTSISVIISNKVLISEDSIAANSVSGQSSATNAGDTTIITGSAGRSIKVGSLAINHTQPAAGAAGSTFASVRSQTTLQGVGGVYFTQSTGFPKDYNLLTLSNLQILLPEGEGLVVNLSQAITGGGFLYINVSYTFIF